MPSSPWDPWPPTSGARPPRPAEDTVSTAALERRPARFHRPSSPWPPTAGAPPPRPTEDTVSTAALERRPARFHRPSSPWDPWPPTAGAPPPRPTEDTVSTAALERRPARFHRSSVSTTIPMPSPPWDPWPWPPTTGAPPTQPTADTVSTAALESRPVEGSRSAPTQEEGSVAAADSAQEARARPPSEDYFSEVKIQEHGEKINRYQGMLAARLKAKYFSNKTSEKGYMFEEIVIQSETIRLSRWPFTRLFADPAKFGQEKSYTEKDVSSSLAGAAMSNN
ncbi:vegetative cell wall protein gp1-like isoform X1 [Panicum virgatum]|uniref:Uncharacterized protein n=1 Tax=Panicum virgatum TaxID=38727 RepID=A0A8T0RHQ5_PANVG|nr:vegetative cell wall protein gp1-like isoform X1 [Panicum virgatum]KAG2584638.1 hypothetical protein PVAP13_6KG316606 [Panicum virgatum]